MALDFLLQQVKNAVLNHTNNQPQSNFDPSGLLGHIEDLFSQHQTTYNPQYGGFGNVRPASEDPLGDPADQAYGRNVRPASEDPLGDPADTFAGRNVRPASEDPLGDPADQLAGRNIRPASEDPLGDPADQVSRAPRRR